MGLTSKERERELNEGGRQKSFLKIKEKEKMGEIPNSNEVNEVADPLFENLRVSKKNRLLIKTEQGEGDVFPKHKEARMQAGRIIGQ